MKQQDLSGRVCLVTGATNGIGRASAQALAGMGAEMVLLCRDAQRGATAVQEIKAASGNDKVELLECDLGVQASVRSATERFLASRKPLHILLNNAGVVNTARRMTTDGMEETWAINHLGPFLLTNLLLERMRESAPARIVNVASLAYDFVRGINWDDLQYEQRYTTFKAYGHSKLANMLFTLELARRLEGTGVTANVLHPGAVNTNLGQHNPTSFLKAAWKLAGPILRSKESGAKTSIYLCSSPTVAEQSGLYWVNCRKKRPRPLALDTEAAARLWQVSLAQTQVASVKA